LFYENFIFLSISLRKLLPFGFYDTRSLHYAINIYGDSIKW
jgi:hypothetical protein